MSLRIAIHDADRTSMPNLALLKLAAWHHAQGDHVERFLPLMPYDRIYSGKVFTYTRPDPSLPSTATMGGTGYGLTGTLPDAVEHTCPDYSFAGIGYSMGFLTRGCIRACPWCIVPAKEGPIRAHADIEEFARHRNVILMDNNVLAHRHGIRQIMKISRLGLHVDFNQGLDARLIDADMARRLGKVRWIRFLRMACDRKSQMVELGRALSRLRAAGGHYREYWCYVLVTADVDDAHERVLYLESLGVTPFAQPYRDVRGAEPSWEQRIFARWCNIHMLRKTTPWSQYLNQEMEKMEKAV